MKAFFNTKRQAPSLVPFCMLTLFVVLTACGSQYNIVGSSDIPTLDGHKLYLKVVTEDGLKNIDSCKIVHGKFNFSGKADQVVLAHVCMDDTSEAPLTYVVLEDGSDILLNLNLARQSASGTPLNDSLTNFFDRYNTLMTSRQELVHRHDQAIMDGSNMDLVYTMLAAEEKRIAEAEDSLVTDFVVTNFDNVLGPGVFFLMTMDQRYPQLTPWIEYIMSKATDTFKNDPYVKEFYDKAQENQKIMNGMANPAADSPAADSTAVEASPSATK
jgi:hypothetical protein